MSNEKSNNGSISFVGLLTIVFITLKLIGTINWPWLWVLAPIWIPLAVGVAIVAIVALCAVIGGLCAVIGNL